MEAEWHTIMYVYICLCVVCGDSQKCVDSVSFPAHVGGYPIWVPIKLLWFALIRRTCTYIHVFMLVCLIACVHSSPFVFSSAPHPRSRERTQTAISLTKFWAMCVSVCISPAIPLQYVVGPPITMALCVMPTVVTAVKPDPHSLNVCFTCLFSQ